MKHRLIIQNEGVLKRAASILQSLEGDFTELHEVIIRPYKSKRSDEQNRRLHKIIGMCAAESGETIDGMKKAFNRELLEPIAFKAKTNEPIYQSTADMNVSELCDFMSKVEMLAAQWFSVTLPYEGEK